MQIEYYKNVIRDVYDLIQPSVYTRHIPGLQSTNTPNTLSLPTPTDSSGQASPRSRSSHVAKQSTSNSQENSAEEEDSDISSQKLQSAASPSKVQCPTQPSEGTENLRTEQHIGAELPAASEPQKALSESRNTSNNLEQNYPQSEKPPELNITPAHKEIEYMKNPDINFQAPLITESDETASLILPDYMNITCHPAGDLANDSGLQNLWTQTSFCYGCGGSGFVKLGTVAENCAFCNYVILGSSSSS